MSQIKKSSKQLPDSNVIFDLYEDDDDDIIFVPPIEASTLRSREKMTTKRINNNTGSNHNNNNNNNDNDNYKWNQSRKTNSNTMKNIKRTIKRRESMGIINSAPVPTLPIRRRKEKEILDQLSMGISRFEI
jgi:hypothetical protein